MSTETSETTQQAQQAGSHHPSWRFYVLIGVILAAITAVEVAIFYMTGIEGLEAPLLITLSSVKFILVVMFFMHLKFDSKVFTTVFLTGVTLASFMVVALVVLYHYLPRFQL